MVVLGMLLIGGLFGLVRISSADQRPIRNIFENIDKDYNKDVMPPTLRGQPVKVGITLRVNAIPKIDDINMEFHIDMYFRQFWKDSRLSFNGGNIKNIKNARLKDRVWLPDPFFVNQKEGYVLDNPSDNTIFKIENDGEVMYSTRQLVTTTCNMDLRKYPFDVQQCNLEIESFSHTKNEIEYYYMKGNQTLEFDTKNLDIPFFTLLGHQLDESTAKTSTGVYNRLMVRFFAKRNPQHFIHNTAIPCCLVILASSVSFWINPVSDGGIRGLIILLSTFGLTAVYLHTAESYLVLNYYTLSDLFFFNCYGFLLLNLLVFFLVLIVGRSAKAREDRGHGGSKCLMKCSWLDVVFRLVFVPLFLVYFVIFATSSGDGTNVDNLILFNQKP